MASAVTKVPRRSRSLMSSLRLGISLVLVQSLEELADVQQSIIARDDRRGGDGHDRGDAPMEPTFVAAGIWEGFEGLGPIRVRE